MDDQLSAITGGLVGTAVMTAILFVADAVTAFRLSPFAVLADAAGFSDRPLLGLAAYFVIGSVVWGLTYESLETYLPGDAGWIRGMVFATVVWTGFVIVVFTAELDTAGTALFLVLTLAAHLAYGFTLGLVYDRLADHPVGTV